ncbi:hypothetical protein HN415_09645 [Candidatus Woesearchaeota archaeon]|nr:hypothetical protein [Candidatus Woesearchaeota archaeon]
MAFIRNPEKPRPKLLCEYEKVSEKYDILIRDVTNMGYLNFENEMVYVMDRGFSGEEICNPIREKLTNKNSIWLNSLEFERFCKDKMKTYDFFLENNIKVPYTEIFEKSNHENQSEFFLKPRYLSKGQGIVNVSDKKNMIIGEEYIIQEKVKIKKIDERKFDFRIVIQKIGINKNIITGVYCRVGKESSNITNFDFGGRIEDPIKILKLVFPNNYDEIYNNLEKISLEIAKKLDGKFSYFQFGLDLIVDEKGIVNALEINSKPGFLGFTILSKYCDKSVIGNKIIEYDKNYRDEWRMKFRNLIESPLKYINNIENKRLEGDIKCAV